jgi:hypothetical protein
VGKKKKKKKKRRRRRKESLCASPQSKLYELDKQSERNPFRIEKKYLHSKGPHVCTDRALRRKAMAVPERSSNAKTGSGNKEKA